MQLQEEESESSDEEPDETNPAPEDNTKEHQPSSARNSDNEEAKPTDAPPETPVIPKSMVTKRGS